MLTHLTTCCFIAKSQLPASSNRVQCCLHAGVAGSVLTGDAKLPKLGDAKLPKLGDVFSGALQFVKKHGKEGSDAKSGSGSSDQNTARQLLSLVCQHVNFSLALRIYGEF